MDLRKELKEIVEQETVELFGINEDEFTDRLVELVKDNFTEKVNNVVLDDVTICHNCKGEKLIKFEIGYGCTECGAKIGEL